MEEALTGCWWNPRQPGSGMMIDDAPETRVAYWYTYADDLPGREENGQIWMIGQPESEDRDKLTFWRPKGTWMGGQYDLGDPVAYADLSLDGDLLVVNYRLVKLGPCRAVNVSPVWHGCSGKLNLQRLTRHGD